MRLSTPEPIYDARVLRLVLDDFGSDLRQQIVAYANYWDDPSILRTQPNSHVVIHYRVGDFLTIPGAESLIISPESVAEAVASFRPRAKSWELIDGGVQHATTSSTDLSPTSVRDRSLEALANVSHAIRRRLPKAKMRASTRRSADEDFFQVAQAPLVVLAGGSFGLAAAAAGVRGQQVRIPACDNHLDVVRTARAPVISNANLPALRDGWKEYAYELLPVGNPAGPPDVRVTTDADGRMRYSFRRPKKVEGRMAK